MSLLPNSARIIFSKRVSHGEEACIGHPCLGAYRVSLKKLKQILEFGAAGETPDNIFRELKSCVDIHTPVGPLLLELSLPMVSGCYTWTVCNPFALLYILCSESLKFGSFAATSSAGIWLL